MKVVRLGCMFVLGLGITFADQNRAAALPTTIAVDGEIYEQVSWGRVTPAEVTIRHRTGRAIIPLEKLTPELQEKFHYDPQKAAEYRAAEEARKEKALKDAAARKAKREALERDRERRQLELMRKAAARPDMRNRPVSRR